MKSPEHTGKDTILREKLAIQRTHLANQTTFLSFLRSSMYFMVAGLTIQNLGAIPRAGIFEVPLFCMSGLLFVGGIINYFRNKKKIKTGERVVESYGKELTEED